MGPVLASLYKLQGIEHDLAHVRRRLRSKQNAVRLVQKKIDDLLAEQKALTEQAKVQQIETDSFELERASREEEITRLRAALNVAKTNKEYAAILTQINSYKADNSKLEEQILKIMENADGSNGQLEKIDAQVGAEQRRLDAATTANAGEVDKLNALLNDLQAKRDDAAGGVTPEMLVAFDRIACNRDGEGMAPIEVVDAKRNEYICGGCYMGLSVEHYSALLSKDEVRFCDSCGRILYIAEEAAAKG